MKECKRCLYHEEIPAISFNVDGLCNYCQQYDEMAKDYPLGEEGMQKLTALFDEIKKAGKGKKYDCVIGVSGGADSSYLLHLAKEHGLRPLAAHFDNTWNSKIAVENIECVLNKLDIDLYTNVVDAEEFDDIQHSFLKASTSCYDVYTDLALAATHYMAAAKYGIKYILEGHSFRTEGITPPGWVYMDSKFVRDVVKKHGTTKIKTLPELSLPKQLKWWVFNRIKKVRPLYYVPYDKPKIKEMLAEEYGWQWYGGHHMENRTSFFGNNYWLPQKFGFDLRIVEYSGLIRGGVIGKEEARKVISEPLELDEDILEEIYKRLNITQEEFMGYIKAPLRSYKEYENYKKTFIRLRPLFYLLYKGRYVTRSFYEKYCFQN